MQNDVLWCFTGSVASTLGVQIYKELLSRKLKALYACTPSASQFIEQADSRLNLEFSNKIFTDINERAWWEWRKEVLHIEITNNIKNIVVAPCSANTLAKIANGLCDNLVMSCLRAAKPETKIIVAPAMNTRMFNHPMTKKHLDILKNDLGYTIVDPIVKRLACGDVGIGAMAILDTIISQLK